MLVERFIAWADSACADERAEAIEEFASVYLDAQTSGADRVECEKIFNFILDDPNPAVRESLSRSLAVGKTVPQALIWNLSQDVASVAAPVFQYSPVLCSKTQIDAIETGCPIVQVAIAKRSNIDGDVARSVATLANANAVLCLLENKSLILGPVLKHDIATRLGNDPAIRAHLLREDDIKPETRQMLVLQLSRSLFDLVDEHEWANSKRIQNAANDSANRVTVDIAMTTDQESMVGYVEHLRSTDQLTPALMLRAICAGNAVFFETAMATLSGVSLKRVQSIVDEGRLAAFKSLYKRTGLPVSAYPVFSAAISVWHELGASGLENESSEVLLCERAVFAIREQVVDDPQLDPKLLAMVQRLCAEAAKNSARCGEQQLLLTAA